MSEKMYRICLSVPLGIRSGTLYLNETNGKAQGWLEIMNHRNDLTGTISKEGTLELQGKLETLVETLSYKATGLYYEGKISLMLKTVFGIYSLTGEEVSQIEKIL